MKKLSHRWLRAGAALVLAILLAGGWAWSAGERTNKEPVGEIPPHQAWQLPDGATVRVHSWLVTDQLPSSVGNKMEKTAPGASFVVVTLEYSGVTPRTHMGPLLYGPRIQRWRDLNLSLGTKHPRYASPGETDLLIDITYQVPTHKVPELRGVSYEVGQERQPPVLLLPPR